MADIVKDMLDTDSYLPTNGKWPNLNLVFNNLRWYPLLIIYFAFISYLYEKGDLLDKLSAGFLIFIWGFLTLMVIPQTAIMLTIISLGILGRLFKPNWLPDKQFIKESKYFKWFLGIISFALLWVSLLSSLAILKAAASLRIPT